jgi:hypothetical protein
MPKKYIFLSLATHLLIIAAFYGARPLEAIRNTMAALKTPVFYVDVADWEDPEEQDVIVQRIEVTAKKEIPAEG